MLRTLSIVVFLSACASPRPQFYPNEHYNQVGEQTAKKDAAECLTKAKEFIKANPLKPIGEKTGWGAATGAAMGAVIGLISGDIKSAVVSGAAAGGVGGAASGAYHATKPDDVERAFTDRCLTEKGYSVIGWR